MANFAEKVFLKIATKPFKVCFDLQFQTWYPGVMRVLVMCEYSGRVRDAFIRKGHYAISCDFEPSDSDLGPHWQGDCEVLLDRYWDLIIAHPPCTALTVAGNSTYGVGKPKHHLRIESAAWTEALWLKACSRAPRVCFENPKGVLPRMTCMPKANFIHPWQFGHPEKKMTGLTLKNLPPLVETDNVRAHMLTLPKKEQERLHYTAPGPNRWKIRSTTFPGIANAMANQWGHLT